MKLSIPENIPEEYLFKQIVNNSPNGILFIDGENRIRFWNRGAQQIFGWESEEVLGNPESFLIPEGSQILEIKNHANPRLREYETERKTKGNGLILVHIAESEIYDSANECIGRSQIIQDISERRKIESRVWQSEKLATAGNLAAGIAHEIGNPLTSISSILQLMKRKTTDKALLDPLNRILSQIERISGIVRDLVDFSRPVTRKQTPTLVNEIIQSAAGLIRYDSRAKHIRIELDLDPNLPVITAVPDQIHQVIVNLMVNALDAMQEKGDKMLLSTGFDRNYLYISVEDEGTGIESHILPHIFEPFYTTKEVGQGTGLGLSVTHGIISRMGGKIDVFTEPGKGSRFLISLPRQSEAI